MELLRNLRMSTRLLFLYEVTTSRHTRLRTIGERLGMTIQGTSEYAHGLEEDGLLSLVGGEYRATKKGIEFLHDHMQELRSFVDRAGKEMAFVETTAAIAGGSLHRGARLGLFMEDGVLVAHEGRASPSTGVAVHDASRGDIVGVRDLEGIVALRPGRIVVGRIRSASLGRKGPRGTASKRLLRSTQDFAVAALDVEGLVSAACSPLRRTMTRDGAHGFFTVATRPTCSSAYGRWVREDSMRQTCFQSKFTARCGFRSIVMMFATGPPTRIMSSFPGPRAFTSVSSRTTSPFGGAKSRPRKNPSSTA